MLRVIITAMINMFIDWIESTNWKKGWGLDSIWISRRSPSLASLKMSMIILHRSSYIYNCTLSHCLARLELPTKCFHTSWSSFLLHSQSVSFAPKDSQEAYERGGTAIFEQRPSAWPFGYWRSVWVVTVSGCLVGCFVVWGLGETSVAWKKLSYLYRLLARFDCLMSNGYWLL